MKPAILSIMLVISFFLFIWQLRRIYRYIKLGQPADRADKPAKRIGGIFAYFFGQKKLLLWRWPGFAHFFIFWGFIILLTTAIEAFGEGYYPAFDFPIIGGTKTLAFAQDLFAILVVAAVIVVSVIRGIVRPTRFEGIPGGHAWLVLALIFLIMISIFGIDAVKANLQENTWVTDAKPISRAFGSMLGMQGWTESGIVVWGKVFWWAHVAMLLFFLAYIPSGKHLHLVTGAPSVYMRNLGRAGVPAKIDLEDEDAESFGVGSVKEFTTKDILDTFSCTECGRCQHHCAAYNGNLPLSPKMLMHDIRHYITGDAGPALLANPEEPHQPLVAGTIETDAIWACTTCGSCEYQCPVFNEHVSHITGMRRHLTLMQGAPPDGCSTVLKKMQSSGNPWGFSQEDRTNWAEGLDLRQASPDEEVDVLYWVGCAGAYDPLSQRTSQAMVKILQKAGVDFAIVGKLEKCLAESARRLGEEYLFYMHAQENIEMLKGLKFKRILAHCPHCFHTLKYEYPQFGGDFPVVHHTELIAELLRSGKLHFKNGEAKRVTYHDSCYLGRINDIYSEPRDILKALPGVQSVEMKRAKDVALCCGGGGGHAWMEWPADQRISSVRLEDALEVRPDVIGTACPFCMIMLDDAEKVKGADGLPKILDIAQLVADSLAD